MNSIKIVYGKRGYHLKVNGMFIYIDFISDDQFKALLPVDNDIPFNSSEWVSIHAIRNFWNKYRLLIIDSTQSPYESVCGRLVQTEKSI